MAPPPGPLPPPPPPGEFSGFCDPPNCIVRVIARLPDGGVAVFREVFRDARTTERGEGVSEVFGADGSVRRVARGVVVLRAEVDGGGNLRALVVPQWDFDAGALDTSVTAGTAIAEFTAAGDLARIAPDPQ